MEVSRATGGSGFVVVCDHASNYLPASYGTLGLPADDMLRHIAWDPGALPVARGLSAALDAPLVESRVSRLAIDCNRPLDAPDLIPTLSEATRIPGNEGLDAAARAERVALSHAPFHAALERVVSDRIAQGLTPALIAIHTFTPVYRGVSRPWHIGIIHDADERLAAPVIAALRRVEGLDVGINQPYSPADRVYYTLERHARARGLPCVMIEIRNDEVRSEQDQKKWTELLSGIFAAIGDGNLQASASSHVDRQPNRRAKGTLNG